MKKLVVLILALCMLCSVASAADLNWADAEEAASKIAGEFKTFDEISVKIWIPDVLKAVGERRDLCSVCGYERHEPGRV